MERDLKLRKWLVMKVFFIFSGCLKTIILSLTGMFILKLDLQGFKQNSSYLYFSIISIINTIVFQFEMSFFLYVKKLSITKEASIIKIGKSEVIINNYRK